MQECGEQSSCGWSRNCLLCQCFCLLLSVCIQLVLFPVVFLFVVSVCWVQPACFALCPLMQHNFSSCAVRIQFVHYLSRVNRCTIRFVFMCFALMCWYMNSVSRPHRNLFVAFNLQFVHFGSAMSWVFRAQKCPGLHSSAAAAGLFNISSWGLCGPGLHECCVLVRGICRIRSPRARMRARTLSM